MDTDPGKMSFPRAAAVYLLCYRQQYDELYESLCWTTGMAKRKSIPLCFQCFESDIQHERFD